MDRDSKKGRGNFRNTLSKIEIFKSNIDVTSSTQVSASPSSVRESCIDAKTRQVYFTSRKNNPYLSWDESEREKFRDEWKTMVGDTPAAIKNFGIKFVLWMHDNIPDMRGRLANFGDVDEGNGLANLRFVKHTQLVVSSLDHLIFCLLEEDPAFEDAARNISIQHLVLTPPVKIETIRDEIHNFIFDRTDLDEESTLACQWYEFMDAFCRIYMEEEVKMEQTRKRRKCCQIL